MCDHDRGCQNRAVSKNKVQYIGAVCDDCYTLYPTQYRVIDPIQARAFLAEAVRQGSIEARDEKVQLEMLAFDSGYEGRPLPEWTRSLGRHWGMDVDDLWYEGRDSAMKNED